MAPTGIVLVLAACSSSAPTGGPPRLALPELAQVAAEVHGTIGSILVVTWEQAGDAEVHAEFSFDDGEWLTSPPRRLSSGPHEELLLGVPYGAEVTWRLVAVGPGGEARTADERIRADDAPETLPPGVVLASDPDAWDPEVRWVFTALNGTGPGYRDPYLSFVVDRAGRAVWALPTPIDRMTMHPRVAHDGRSLLVDHNSFWQTYDGGRGSTIRRVLIDGSEVESWDVPGLHHPFTDLPDGSLAYGAADRYVEETLEVVRPDRSRETLWSCRAFLEQVGSGEYCGSNTLSHDPATDALLFSFYSVETVVEIDASTGETRRWFGHAPGAWTFDPPSSAFWWQHGGHYTAAGTFLTSSYREASGEELVLREYAVDEASRALREVWSFGEGEGLFGEYMGEGHRLPGGNTLQNLGSNQRLREVTPEGTVVWDVVFEGVDGEIGRSTPITDLYALASERR